MSLAWAFAPTEAERAIIGAAHRDAVDAAMHHVEREIGRARKGKAGREGFEPGRIGWLRFEHYASRPTVEVPRRDAATGEAYTELVTLKVAGEAAALGWRHASVLRPDPIPLPAREERIEQAYQAALTLLDRDLQRRAVLDAAVARVAAARG